jgi:hypothetical protein
MSDSVNMSPMRCSSQSQQHSLHLRRVLRGARSGSEQQSVSRLSTPSSSGASSPGRYWRMLWNMLSGSHVCSFHSICTYSYHLMLDVALYLHLVAQHATFRNGHRFPDFLGSSHVQYLLSYCLLLVLSNRHTNILFLTTYP